MCAQQLGHCRANYFEIRELRTRAAWRFADVGIDLQYVDTAVITFLIAESSRLIIHPLGYCLAVGRRLQEEAVSNADKRRREIHALICNTCPHGSAIEGCSDCEQDRANALDLFPSLRCYLPDSLIPSPDGDKKA